MKTGILYILYSGWTEGKHLSLVRSLFIYTNDINKLFQTKWGTKFVVEKVKIMLTLEVIVTIGIKIFFFIIFPY